MFITSSLGWMKTHTLRVHLHHKTNLHLTCELTYQESLFGSYVLLERLDGCDYFAFLQEVLPDMLNYVSIPIHQCIRFQYDGVSAHFSQQVRKHLQTNFFVPYIGRSGPTHGHQDHQICLQLILFAVFFFFFKNLFVGHLCHCLKIQQDEMFRQKDVLKIHMGSLRRHTV